LSESTLEKMESMKAEMRNVDKKKREVSGKNYTTA
jgi:hypothetical protein